MKAVKCNDVAVVEGGKRKCSLERSYCTYLRQSTSLSVQCSNNKPKVLTLDHPLLALALLAHTLATNFRLVGHEHK